MKIGLIASILALLGGQACAANEVVIINTPANDSIVSATYRTPIVYEIAPDANNNDLRVYVDGSRVDALRHARGEIELEPISAGKHRICLALNSKSSELTGKESCVDVMAR
jgi:hypothetical protein